MMKGIFKGLRCIFDTDNEKEPEIQIGAPTDVKHVAHIGCDGPSTPAPSWMNEYQGGSEPQAGEIGSRDVGSASSRPHKTKQSKRGSDSPSQKPRKSKNNSESAANESSRTRRIKNSILGSESQAEEANAKKTRKKKGEGTTRPSRNKNKDPSTADDTYSDSGCNDVVCPKPLD